MMKPICRAILPLLFVSSIIQAAVPGAGLQTGESLRKWKSDMIAKHDSPASSSLFYTGKPFDEKKHGYLFKFRSYDPRLNRWTSFDPSGFPDGANNLLYVNNLVLWSLDREGLDIYHINNASAVGGAGHSGAIVGNNSTGYDYYSFGPDGKGVPVGNGALTHQRFDTLNEAFDFARNNGYDKAQGWSADENADAAARGAAQNWDGADYNAANTNCWDMVADMLDQAGMNFVDRTQMPNQNFNDNEAFVDWNIILE